MTRVVTSGQHAGGVERALLEEFLAERLGRRAGVGVQSGSAALHLALLALGVGPGQSVLVPSFACAALLNAVSACGAAPVLVDIDPETLNATVESTERGLARAHTRPAVAIVVHMVGNPVARELFEALDQPVIEDCAMALGASDEQQREIGSRGAISVLSFFATKMISCGQGGMVLADDEEVIGELRDLIRYDEREDWRRTSWNYPLSDLCAALALAQARALDGFLTRRREIVGRYAAICQRRGIPTIASAAGARPNHYRFVLRLVRRERAEEALRGEHIECKCPVFRPLHRYLGLPPEHFPGAEEAARTSLSIPAYPALTDDQVDRVCAALERLPAESFRVR